MTTISESGEVTEGPIPVKVPVGELFPSIVVMYDNKPQQVRGVSLSGSLGLTKDMKVREHSFSYTVVFCDEDGRITTRVVPYDTEFEVHFIEVFEPDIPAGYVSRKNFKKCYEDSLASVDGVTPPRTVNNGSKWRAKRDLQSVLLQPVKEGTTCTVYAVSATGCRLMLPSGGDLGNIGTVSLMSDFYYVEDTSTRLVELRYYKPGGKYYSDGRYVTYKSEFHDVLNEVYDKLLSGDSPGMTDYAVIRNDFTTSVHIHDDRMDIPHVVTAQALCAEVARRSKREPMKYVTSLSKETLSFYRRHQNEISRLLPDDFVTPRLE